MYGELCQGGERGALGGLLRSARWSTPMPRAVTIRSLPRAFEFLKAMQALGLEWSDGCHGLRQCPDCGHGE